MLRIVAAFPRRRHRSVGVDVRTVLDLFARERGEEPAMLDIDPPHRRRGEQDAPATQPAARVHDEVPHGPALVVEKAIHDLADVAVDGGDRHALDVFDAARDRRLG